MIQRKQTLFLIIAICAMVLCFTFPIARYSSMSSLQMPVTGELNLIAKHIDFNPEQLMSLEPIALGQDGFFNAWPLTLITIGVMAISLISIFLFKKRTVQMKVVAFGFLLSVLDIALTFAWAVDACQKALPFNNMGCTDVTNHFGIGSFAPIVAAAMLFLAQRAIKKDEEMVRAADRLR